MFLCSVIYIFFFYYRDSFVTNSEKYRWQEKFTLYRVNKKNSTVKLYETIGDYFNGVVLQRYNYIENTQTSSVTNKNVLGSVRFQLAFNLAIIWTFIFIILCKNLRSFGKIVPLFTIMPIIGLIIILIKFLTIININNIDNIIPSPDWDNFFINSQCWLSAAQETFLTWGLLGGTIIKIYSYTSKNIKFKKFQLRNDAIIIVFLTIFILLLASVLGTICVQILNNNGYYYLPGSYGELIDSCNYSIFVFNFFFFVFQKTFYHIYLYYHRINRCHRNYPQYKQNGCNIIHRLLAKIISNSIIIKMLAIMPIIITIISRLIIIKFTSLDTR